MKISHSWLSDFIKLDQPTEEEISEVLTQVGLEVEGVEKVEKIPGGLQGLVVGEVIECEQHPNADKLKKTLVTIGGDEDLPIVCGAPNVAKGQKVIVAPVNTTIYPTNGEPFKIKKAKIRGEVSQGMICAEDEIGLGTGHDGILVLSNDAVIGSSVAELYALEDDTVYEIGLTPNRGDAASHFGSARDLKAFYKKEITFPQIGQLDIAKDSPIEVEVENFEACPRYSGVTIRGIKVQPSPEWLQFRLKSIGLTPINNIVDITNYVLHGLGQPLHAFDADKIKGGKVIVKTLPGGTKFTTLDEKERSLSDKDLMICDTQDGMCIAGVFGGIHSGITESTTSIFLESAYFSADWVRATAQRHSLSTDASFRYERGTDPNMTIDALKYATSLILELAGGKVGSDWIDIYPNPIKPVEIATTYEYINRIIGKELSKEEIKSILELLDISIENKQGDHFVATVPPYRSEVTRPADLVEEVLRIHGINNVEVDPFFSTDFLSEFNENEPYKIQEKASHLLAGLGFHEMVTNSLTNAAHDEKLGLGGQPIKILNKSSEELGIMKTSPLYTSLEVLKHNINRRQPNLKLYEFCRTYEKTEKGYSEKEWLTILVTGDTEESWHAETRKLGFHDLAGPVVSLLNHLNLPASENRKLAADKSFQGGLELIINTKTIARVGSVQSEVLRHFEIGQEVYYAAIDWQLVIKYVNPGHEFKSIPKFPEVRRDLSLVIDESVSFAEIEEIAFKSEKKLLTRVNVFSVYQGDRIEQGKKSYAVSFFLQDTEKTLNDKQIDRVMSNLIKQFEERLSATIRR